MSKIYVARHGQDEDNAAQILNGHRDTRLTALGRKQARELASKVSALGIQTIVSSPLRRALETSRIVGGRIGLTPRHLHVHPLLVEQHFGVLTGKSYGEIELFTKDFLETDHLRYFLSVPELEDFPTVYKRAAKALADIRANYGNRNVLIVCHGITGNMIRAAYYRMHWKEFLKQYGKFLNCDVFELTIQSQGGCLL